MSVGNLPLKAPTDHWFREYAEARGGVLHGILDYPLSPGDAALYASFKSPPDMELLEVLWTSSKKLAVWSAPKIPGHRVRNRKPVSNEGYGDTEEWGW